MLSGAIGALLSAILGVGSLLAAGFVDVSNVLPNLLYWWQGNVLGIILFSTLILVWQAKPEFNFSLRSVLLAVLCFLLAFLCGQIVFLGWFSSLFAGFPQPFWIYIFLTWVSIAYGRHGVLILLVMFVVQGCLSILDNFSVFNGVTQQQAMIHYWLFMVTATILGMILSFSVFTQRQSQKELRESEERWNFALEGAGDGVWDWDLNSDKVHLSANFMRMYDYGGDSVDANPSAWSKLVHPDDMEQVMQDFDKHLAGETPYYENEHRVQCSNGTYKWILDRGMVVRYSNKGEPLRMVGTHTDITDRKKIEAELLDAKAELEDRVAERTKALALAKQQIEAALEVKTEFLSNMSHEIRTPISNILGMAYLMLEADPSSKLRDYIIKIQTAGRHLLALVDDVLDFSRLETGRLELTKEVFCLDETVRSLAAAFDESLMEKKLQLQLEIDPRIDNELLGDSARLQQMLGNYLSNAIKFSEKGTIKIHIYAVASNAIDYMLRFEVIDQGVGISPDQQSKLFAAFQQADMTIRRRFGGSGLGLAICRRLAGMMNGEVGFESRYGQGSTFWFSVKLARANPQPIPEEVTITAQNPAVTNIANNKRLTGMRVLLAEDNAFNQQVAQELLEMAGASVVVANDGQEALQHLRQAAFDCVLMDLRMPVLDGLEATRFIRADEKLRDTIVIAMTANTWDVDRERCLQAGMDDFLSKPVQPSHMIEVVAEWARCNQSLPVEASVLAGLFGDDKEKISSLMTKFVSLTREELGILHAAVERQDVKTVREVGHKLKSSARQVGAGRFAEICERLSDQTEPADWPQLAAHIRQLDKILSKIAHQFQLSG